MANSGKILDAGIIKNIEHYYMKNNILKNLEWKYEHSYQTYIWDMEHGKNPEPMIPPTEMSNADLYKYYDIKPFRPSWMLNISPNWKGRIDEHMIAHFKKVMDIFFHNCDRFTNATYVLECGGDGDFLHCHAVFKLNPKKPGNIASLKKGNFLKEFRSVWDRCGDYKGLVKSRHALQTTLITREDMLEDKLNYLIEEKKPESHKNAIHSILPLTIELSRG